MKTMALPRLEQRRAYLFWTQKQLAKVAGVSAGTISRAENGRPISLTSAEKLAKAVGRRIEQLSAPLIHFITEADADYPLGLLAPDGRYHPVEYAGHSDEAYRVTELLYPAEAKAHKKQYGWLNGLDFLRERGWVDIHSEGDVEKRSGHTMTQPQRDFLFDLAMARHARAGGRKTWEVMKLMRAAGFDPAELEVSA